MNCIFHILCYNGKLRFYLNRVGDMKKLIIFIKLCFLGMVIGILGGAVSACFAHSLALVTDLRQNAPWLVLLLPVGAVVTAAMYRIFRMQDHRGANEIILGLANKTKIRTMAAPLIFVSSAITHLLGGSAGREGAALQLGGAGAAALCQPLGLKEEARHVSVTSGMCAVFAGLFGTPLTATFFVLEFKSKPRTTALSFLPCLIAATAAANLSAVLGVAAETVHLHSIVPFSFITLIKIIPLALGLSLLGHIMCTLFHGAGSIAKRLVSNDLLRGGLFAALIVAMTALVGDMRYNGSGMSMAIGAVEGHAHWFDFLLKLLFTAITLAAGLKGGEIVPTFCIGATFGCIFGGILGLDMGFSAALGLVGLFCCATNSPISGTILGAELFGLSALPYCGLICLLLWPISAKNGLFQNRVFRPKWM